MSLQYASSHTATRGHPTCHFTLPLEVTPYVLYVPYYTTTRGHPGIYFMYHLILPPEVTPDVFYASACTPTRGHPRCILCVIPYNHQRSPQINLCIILLCHQRSPQMYCACQSAMPVEVARPCVPFSVLDELHSRSA